MAWISNNNSYYVDIYTHEVNTSPKKLLLTIVSGGIPACADGGPCSCVCTPVKLVTFSYGRWGMSSSGFVCASVPIFLSVHMCFCSHSFVSFYVLLSSPLRLFLCDSVHNPLSVCIWFCHHPFVCLYVLLSKPLCQFIYASVPILFTL